MLWVILSFVVFVLFLWRLYVHWQDRKVDLTESTENVAVPDKSGVLHALS